MNFLKKCILLFILLFAILFSGCSKKDKRDASLDEKPTTPMMTMKDAMGIGNVSQVWSNIYHKTTPIDGSSRGFSLLHDAMMEYKVARSEEMKANYKEIFRLLLENGANPNRDEGGTPILGVAAEEGVFFAVELLVEYGASLEYGHWDKNLLSLAVKGKNPKVVKFLVDNGAKVIGGRGRNKSNALKYANLMKSSEEIISILEDALAKEQ